MLPPNPPTRLRTGGAVTGGALRDELAGRCGAAGDAVIVRKGNNGKKAPLMAGAVVRQACPPVEGIGNPFRTHERFSFSEMIMNGDDNGSVAEWVSFSLSGDQNGEN
jgi:hypothetical protein